MWVTKLEITQFPKEFTMIDQFITEFEKFVEYESEAFEGLSDEAKVALFGIYANHIASRSKKPVKAARAEKPRRRQSRPTIKNPHRPASVKQLKCIVGMIEKGQLDEDIDTDDLTMGEASNLIDQGIKNSKRRRPDPEPEVQEEEDEPQGSFQGAYNNQSGSLASEGSIFG